MLRTTEDAYALFEKHPDAFTASSNFTEFYKAANLNHLDAYAGGWVEDAFQTLKVGKRTHRALLFPQATKFSDLFDKAYFLPTDAKDKPQGVYFVSGSRGGAIAMHVGGKRGWSERTPDTRSHYGAKFYGTYAAPCAKLRTMMGKGGFSFEAIRREDGILICVRQHDYVGSDWVALLDLSENIETLFDDETRALLAAERQAAIDAWGEVEK